MRRKTYISTSNQNFTLSVNYNAVKIFNGVKISQSVKIKKSSRNFCSVNLQSSPTVKLLASSTVVALSGGFRLHIAFLLAGLPANIPVYCAGVMIIYSTYTLDRTLDCAEDAVNRAELCGAKKKIGMIACIASFLAGLLIFAYEGIYLAPFFPFIIGYFYTHGIPVGQKKLKLKGGAGIKNIVTGITWGGTIALIVSRYCSELPTVGMIFLFFGAKTFVTSCVNDFKDVRGDILAGIHTLPACLGEGLTKLVLIATVLGVHCVMFYSIILGIIGNGWAVLIIGLVILVTFLLVYSPAFEKSNSVWYRKMREVAISWESAVSIGLPYLARASIQALHLL